MTIIQNDEHVSIPNKVINLQLLESKISSIDFHELVTTISRLLESTLSNDVVMSDEAEARRLLESCKTLNVDGLLANDHEILMKVMHLLARVIVMAHISELRAVTVGKANDHSITRVSISPIHTSNGMTDILTTNVKVRDTGSVNIQLDVPSDLQDLLRRLIARLTFPKVTNEPLDRARREDAIRLSIADMTYAPSLDNQGTKDYASGVMYNKIMLELLTLDDHSMESIIEYSKSQHDWVISTVFNIINKFSSCKANKYTNRLIDIAITPLLYGCRWPNGDADLRLIKFDIGHDRQDGKTLLREVNRACSFRRSDCYDHKALDFAMKVVGNDTQRIYPYSAVLDALEGATDDESSDVEPDRELAKNVVRRYVTWPIGTVDCVDSIYRRNFTVKWCSYSGEDRSVVNLPDDLRAKVTADYVRSLEAKTHVIASYMLMMDVGNRMIDGLKMGEGDDLTRTISADQMNELVKAVGYYLNDEVFIVPWEPNRKRSSSRVNYGMGYTPSDDEAEVDMRRHALVKMEQIHELVRHHKHVPEDYITDLTPLDLLVMGDLIQVVKQLKKTGMNQLTLDEDDCMRLSGACLEACQNLNGTDDDGKNLIYDGIYEMYSRMVDGDLKDVEKTLDALDDAFVEGVIDYYVNHDLKLGGDASMPEEFMEEDLKMASASRYKEVLSGFRK